jgi:hypothetical protein
MAEKLAFPEANVADPRWILNEESGKLSHAGVRWVHSHPAQALMVSHARKTCSMAIADRYLRIMADKRRRRDG